MSNLVYKTGENLGNAETIFIWLALILAAAIVRRRFVTFFVCFALLAPLPVVFIPFRGFFVMYLPLAGWAMAVASLLVIGKDRLLLLWRERSPVVWGISLHQGLLFLAVAGLMAWMRTHDPDSQLRAVDPSHAIIRSMRNDILQANEPLHKAAYILFRHDRFPAGSWGLSMICRLLYHDRALTAKRPDMMSNPPDESQFDRVFDYVGGKLSVVRSRPVDSSSPPAVNFPR